jgi:hypothetical protein
MTRPLLSFDAETGSAYISLAATPDDLVETSVHLWPVDDQPDALRSLVLDFGADGRLIGIKVLKRAEQVLRSELLGEVRHGRRLSNSP